MASAVDATVPADNIKADKAQFRANFLIIKNELTSLGALTQRKTSLAWQTALNVISLTSM